MRVHSSGVRLVFAALCAARSAVAQPPKAVAVKPDAEIGARLGQPAPDFTLKTLAGTEVSLSSLKGRPVILNFWASWCPPCRVEMPLLMAAYRAHRDAGLEVVAINLTDQEAAKDIRKFVAEFQMPFAVALDTKGKTWGRYGLLALPTTVFVSSDGTVRLVNSGPINGQTLDRDLALILPPP
jgi:thiol-disulfide isomerase/thioredoxin